MNPNDLEVFDSTAPADGDDSLVRWMLSLSPGERIAVLQGFVDSVHELADAGPAQI